MHPYCTVIAEILQLLWMLCDTLAGTAWFISSLELV